MKKKKKINAKFLTASTVTESGVRLLAAQKPIKRQDWWKGVCFISDASNRG